jgi:hypothetical protein
MKKNIVALFLIPVLVFSFKPEANAQGFSAGGKIGMGLSTLSNWDSRSSGSDSKSRSPLVALDISLTGKYMFNDFLGLQAELQYVQKGEVLKTDGTSDTIYKVKTKINYLTIPILVSVNKTFGEIKVYGNIGPYIGIGLTGHYVIKGPVEGGEELKFQEGGLRRFDMGLCIGAGVGYRFGPGDIIFDLRYDLGFIDTNSTPDDEKGSNYKSTCNRTFAISVGYVIPIGQ